MYDVSQELTLHGQEELEPKFHLDTAMLICWNHFWNQEILLDCFVIFWPGYDPFDTNIHLELKFKKRFIAMITVGMNYHVIEGKQQDFEDKFAGVIDALNAADGHTQSNLWKDVADGASYLITSEWTDEDAFKAFISSDAFRAVTNWGKEQILSGRPQHKIYKN